MPRGSLFKAQDDPWADTTCSPTTLTPHLFCLAQNWTNDVWEQQHFITLETHIIIIKWQRYPLF